MGGSVQPPSFQVAKQLVPSIIFASKTKLCLNHKQIGSKQFPRVGYVPDTHHGENTTMLSRAAI